MAEVNTLGCAPSNGWCLAHNDELECSHGCGQGHRMWEHFRDCSDPPPPLETAWPGFVDNCIGCGRDLRAGDPIRRYADGNVCGMGCLEKDPPS